MFEPTNHAKPKATLWFSTVDSNALEHSNWIKFQLLEQTLHLFNSELKQNLLDCHCHIWLKRQKRNPLIHTSLSNKNHKTITKQQQSERTTKNNRLKRRKIGKPLQNFFVCVHSFFFIKSAHWPVSPEFNFLFFFNSFEIILETIDDMPTSNAFLIINLGKNHSKIKKK